MTAFWQGAHSWSPFDRKPAWERAGTDNVAAASTATPPEPRAMPAEAPREGERDTVFVQRAIQRNYYG